MTVTTDKTRSESAANHYYETAVHKLSRSGISSAHEFNLIYDANPSTINVRLGYCGFIGMFSGTSEQIRSVIANIYDNDIVPIEPISQEDDEVSIEYHASEEALYHILHLNAMEMNRLLPIKWSNDVLKKLRWVKGNTVRKLKMLLLAGTLNTSLSSVGQSTMHITSISSLKESLHCSTPKASNFWMGES